jgi:hypothetical protein
MTATAVPENIANLVKNVGKEPYKIALAPGEKKFAPLATELFCQSVFHNCDKK